MKRYWSILIALGLVAAAAVVCPPLQLPVRAPTLTPFADGADWVLKADMPYVIGRTGLIVIVPKGFVTDFASIPPALRSRFALVGTHGRAAIVHDFLYWDQGCTRDQADRLFLLAMRESGVTPDDQRLIYEAVHLGGASAWAANARDRQNGLPRIIPDAMIDIPDDVSWGLYRARLAQRGVKPETQPRPRAAPDYCAAGDVVSRPPSTD